MDVSECLLLIKHVILTRLLRRWNRRAQDLERHQEARVQEREAGRSQNVRSGSPLYQSMNLKKKLHRLWWYEQVVERWHSVREGRVQILGQTWAFLAQNWC